MMKFSILLYGIYLAIRFMALRSPAFKQRLGEKNLVAQIKLQDNSIGRYFELRNGRVSSRAGIHPSPDVTMFFKNVRIAFGFSSPLRTTANWSTPERTFRWAQSVAMNSCAGGCLRSE